MNEDSVLIEEPGLGQVETFPLKTTQEELQSLLTDLFENHWTQLVFGILIEGAVFELTATDTPKVSMHDGYLTVVFGESHFHVCIGEHRGSKSNPTPLQLARHRRTSRAEFFRMLSPEDNAPTSWGFRMFNGAGEQQLTIFLPNPFLGDVGKILAKPQWQKLKLWDQLRLRHLGLTPDSKDRMAKRFWHA